MHGKIALLNTTIATTDGTYEVKTVSLGYVLNYLYDELMNMAVLDSAIGHESTAQIMDTLLRPTLKNFDLSIEMNRQMFAQEVGQTAIVFKLKGRAPEGKILSAEEIEAVGYDWKLMTRTA